MIVEKIKELEEQINYLKSKMIKKIIIKAIDFSEKAHLNQ